MANYFRVIDFETNGLMPVDPILEFGWCDVREDSGRVRIQGPVSVLFGTEKITIAAAEVHHLTADDLAGKLPCTRADLAGLVTHVHAETVLVAHRNDFERRWIDKAGAGDHRWICTFKCALRVWPDAPYVDAIRLFDWLLVERLIRPDITKSTPHYRAGPGVYREAQILKALLKEATTADLVYWSTLPLLWPRVPTGTHRGRKLSEVPGDYLIWAAGAPGMGDDWRHIFQTELDRREAIAPA